MSNSTEPDHPAGGDSNDAPPATNNERLALIYGRPGPYVTLYLATNPLLPEPEMDLRDRWQALRHGLEKEGASVEVLCAIDEAVAIGSPDDVAAISVIAAADTSTVVDYGLEPPKQDIAVFDALPYAAPLLEWEQRRLPHMVVTIDDEGADIALFGPRLDDRLDSLTGSPAELVEPTATLAQRGNARLIVVSGPRTAAQHLASALALRVPIECRIVAEPGLMGVDELAEATVRHVSDTVARGTVGYLRELRFLASHSAAVDGTAETIAALRDGSADVLLIHDDPADDRRVWTGPDPQHISVEPMAGHEVHARLVDAAIRAAVLTGVSVHIIPTTGPNGPDDNTAALQRSTSEKETR